MEKVKYFDFFYSIKKQIPFKLDNMPKAPK